MSRLLGEQKAVIITTLDGCMDPLLPLEVLKKYVMTIGVGSVLETEAMKLRLVQMGYERVGQVEMPGQFAIRGGIIDIYPLTEEYPVRVDCGMMRWIRSGVLMQRASVPLKIWTN